MLGYGLNESFAGSVGLDEFRQQLEVYLKEIARLHPNAKLVLLSPIAVEDDDKRNLDVAAYAQAMAEIAEAHRAQFVNLYAASLEAYKQHPEPLTTQGIHLNEAGNHEMAKVIVRAMLGGAALNKVDTSRIVEIAKAAAQNRVAWQTS